MKKIACFIVYALACLLSSAVQASAQDDCIPSPENLAARERFEDMRLGVFLHWGLYSMFAQGERMNVYGESVYGTASAKIPEQSWV